MKVGVVQKWQFHVVHQQQQEPTRGSRGCFQLLIVQPPSHVYCMDLPASRLDSFIPSSVSPPTPLVKSEMAAVVVLLGVVITGWDTAGMHVVASRVD